MHPMTEEEFEQYRNLVKRKGKAMTVPKELRLGKYGREYEKIVDTLQRQFQAYVAYYITGGKGDLPVDADIAAKVKGQKAIYVGMNTALYDGDLKKLDQFCDRLKRVYENAKGDENAEGEGFESGEV